MRLLIGELKKPGLQQRSVASFQEAQECHHAKKDVKKSVITTSCDSQDEIPSESPHLVIDPRGDIPGIFRDIPEQSQHLIGRSQSQSLRSISEEGTSTLVRSHVRKADPWPKTARDDKLKAALAIRVRGTQKTSVQRS